MYFSFSRAARACARACVIKHSLIYGPTLFKFAVNILQITTSSMGYVLFMFVSRLVKHSLIFGRILFKFAGHILQMTTSYMGYTLIMFTHRGHTRERAFASACVINCSLMYRRFLFKFGVNIHITASRRDTYFSCSRTARTCASARVRARAWLNIQLSLDGFSSNVMGTTTKDHKLHGIHTYHVQSLRACACASASVIKRSLIFERILFKFDGDLKQIPISYMRYLMCV
jgi:hypothetical protein